MRVLGSYAFISIRISWRIFPNASDEIKCKKQLGCHFHTFSIIRKRIIKYFRELIYIGSEKTR
jgi:hypothetical protein